MAAGSTASPPDLPHVRADHDHKLEAEIARLDDLGLDELRKLWGRFLGRSPRTTVRSCCVGAWAMNFRRVLTATCRQRHVAV